RRMAKYAGRKDRYRNKAPVALRTQDCVGRERHFGGVEFAVVEHAPERLAWSQRNECQIDPFRLHSPVDKCLSAVVAPASNRQFKVLHGVRVSSLLLSMAASG